jgi:phosphatidylserine/phosphatidylglycerophosphate/cardiolipin synthase-like enzyme
VSDLRLQLSVMRQLAVGVDFSVNAVSGTRCVLLCIDGDLSALKSGAEGFPCVGFVIKRTGAKDGAARWLYSSRRQPISAEGPKAEEEDLDAVVERVASLQGPDAEGESQAEATQQQSPGEDPAMSAALSLPIQRLRWSDYTVEPGAEYRYTVYRVINARGSPSPTGSAVEIHIRTEPELSDGGIFFNRGVAGSQAYVAQFGTTKPRDKAAKASSWGWLSRGLEEGLLGFLSGALDDSYSIHAACYEFSYAPVLEALKAAEERGAMVRVIYDAKASRWSEAKKEWVHGGPGVFNEAAIAATGLGPSCIPRREGPRYIQHNKFFLLSHKGTPVRVWTGSTNITTGGIFGHSNCGHIHGSSAIAMQYMLYWKELAKDPILKEFRATVEALSPLPSLPLPIGAAGGGAATIFSPRPDESARLRLGSARQWRRVCCMLLPGLTRPGTISLAVRAMTCIPTSSWRTRVEVRIVLSSLRRWRLYPTAPSL